MIDVKKIREKIGLTQEGLSEATSIPRDRIAKWEQGKSSPKAADYLILDKLLNDFEKNKNGFMKENINQNEVVDRFVTLWKELNIKSLQEFCNEIGISIDQFYDIENRKNQIDSKLKDAIFNKYTFSHKWFLYGIGNFTDKNEESESLENKIELPKNSFHDKLFLNKVSNDLKLIPVYDLNFAAGFVELIRDTNPEPIAYLTIPEVQGCDYIIRAKGDSMVDIINDKDWIGIKRHSKENIIYSEIYAIVSNEFQIIKFIQYSSNEGEVILASKNKDYPPYPYLLDNIIDLYIVRTVLPFSKIKTLI